MGFLADRKILITGMLSQPVDRLRHRAAPARARARRSPSPTSTTSCKRPRRQGRGRVRHLSGAAVRRDPRRRHRRAVRGAAARVGRARRHAAFDRLRAARGAGRRLPRTACRAPRSRPRTTSARTASRRWPRARGRCCRGARASLLTLTYLGALRALPNYNVMGLAKASLEANVRYLAACLGPEGIRVNGISAGPIKTLAAAGIGGFSKIFNFVEKQCAAAAQRHHRRGRQRRRVLFLRSGQRHHRRDHLRRRGFSTVGGGPRRRLMARARGRPRVPAPSAAARGWRDPRAGGGIALTCARRAVPAGGDGCPALRRRRHRRRPQRPGLRRLPRRRRPVGVRARAPRRAGRRGGDRGIPPGLPQLDGELHGQPAESAR